MRRLGVALIVWPLRSMYMVGRGVRSVLPGGAINCVVGQVAWNCKTGRGAEIGRQAALRAQCSKGRVGSNPTLGTS